MASSEFAHCRQLGEEWMACKLVAKFLFGLSEESSIIRYLVRMIERMETRDGMVDCTFYSTSLVPSNVTAIEQSAVDRHMPTGNWTLFGAMISALNV